MPTTPLRLGTRGSQLARWQAEHVASLCRARGIAIEIIEITTTGDHDQSTDLAGIGTVGLFTKELQRALLSEQIDLAVHSLKDLPTTPVAGLTLAAVPERETVHDALLTHRASSLHQLTDGSTIGTASTRRVAQLLALNPTWKCEPIRGNVDTRLRKLDEGAYDAIILAAAGLTRLGLADRITQHLPLDVMLPAPGQGALGIECRADDAATLAALRSLDDPAVHACVTAERSLLAHIEGGCLAAVGAHATINGDTLSLATVVLHPYGQQRITYRDAAAWDGHATGAATELGLRVGDALLAQGAAELLSAGPRRLG